MFALSSVVGPLLGGFLTDGPGWRYAFWINVPIGGFCLMVLQMYVPRGLGQAHTASGRRMALLARREAAKKAALEAGAGASAVSTDSAQAAASADVTIPKTTLAQRVLRCGRKSKAQAASEALADPELSAIKDESIDFLGSLLIVTAVILLCLALVWGGGEFPWTSGRIIALLTVAGILLIAFVGVEARVAAHPLMPMRLFSVRNFTVGAFISFMAGMSLTGG